MENGELRIVAVALLRCCRHGSGFHSAGRVGWWLSIAPPGRRPARPIPTIDEKLRRRLREFARRHPRLGWRKAHVVVRREGFVVNHKKLRRLWRKEGLRRQALIGSQRQLGARLRPPTPPWSGSRRQCHPSLFVPPQFQCQTPCQPSVTHHPGTNNPGTNNPGTNNPGTNILTRRDR